MARAQGARAQRRCAFETNLWHAAGGGELLANAVRELVAGSERPLLASELLGYGRDPLPPVPDVENADGDIVVPIDLRAWGVWLKGCVRGADHRRDRPPRDEFRSGGWTLPSMSIELGMPEVPHYAMNSGAVVNTLSWTMQRSGLLTATVGLIAQGESVDNASAVGAVNRLGGGAVRAVQRGGGAEWRGARQHSLGADHLHEQPRPDRDHPQRRHDRGGGSVDRGADRRHRGALRQPDAVEPGGRRGRGGAEVLLHPQRERGGRAVAHAVYLPKPRLPIQGPQGVQASFEWQAAREQTSGACARRR